MDDPYYLFIIESFSTMTTLPLPQILMALEMILQAALSCIGLAALCAWISLVVLSVSFQMDLE